MKMNKKGFTLMEMLIVIAIIAILIAIAIPTFTAALEKSRQKTDLANARALKSLVVSQYMSAESTPGSSIDVKATIDALTDTNKATFYLNKDGQQLCAKGTSAMPLTSKDFKAAAPADDKYVSCTFDSNCLMTDSEPAITVES